MEPSIFVTLPTGCQWCKPSENSVFTSYENRDGVVKTKFESKDGKWCQPLVNCLKSNFLLCGLRWNNAADQQRAPSVVLFLKCINIKAAQRDLSFMVLSCRDWLCRCPGNCAGLERLWFWLLGNEYWRSRCAAARSRLSEGRNSGGFEPLLNPSSVWA